MATIREQDTRLNRNKTSLRTSYYKSHTERKGHCPRKLRILQEVVISDDGMSMTNHSASAKKSHESYFQ